MVGNTELLTGNKNSSSFCLSLEDINQIYLENEKLDNRETKTVPTTTLESKRHILYTRAHRIDKTRVEFMLW